MELEIYQALTSVNVSPEKAEAVAVSIQKEIDKRYSLHSAQLFTKSDGSDLKAQMAEMKTELIKWTIGSMFAAIGLFATITKLWH